MNLRERLATTFFTIALMTLFLTAENLLGLEHETFGIIAATVRGPVESPSLSSLPPRRFEAGLRVKL